MKNSAIDKYESMGLMCLTALCAALGKFAWGWVSDRLPVIHTGISLIGMAGERRLVTAGITNCDMEGEPTRYNGRGGLGAVMGSKRVHALFFEPAGTTPPLYADRTEFLRIYRGMARVIHANTTIFRKYGTASVMDVTSNFGALPTRNYSAGRFEHAEAINGVALHRLITERGGAGRISHACMPGCLVQCSNIFPDKDGNKLCSPIEYENLGMLGSNLGIGSLDAIAELNRLCNDLGCDTIEIGAALGVLMEQGVCAFGDAEGAKAILREIFTGGVTGLLAGSGVAVAGLVLGASRIPVFHGQSFAAYDPRSMKGTRRHDRVVYGRGNRSGCGGILDTTVESRALR